MKPAEKYFPYLLIVGILINANGLLYDILEPDGALYATIAKHIALTNDWLNLFGDNHDWLDKPHFPFWVSAASFKIFGITAFAYKLPAFIFWLIGTWFTYQLTVELYNKETAKVAVLVYIFSLHGILNNFDVRAEPYLTALIIAAIYYLHKAQKTDQWKYFVLAALVSGCAVMTKGIFTLISIGAGLAIFWAFTNKWKQFLYYKWWLMIALIVLFISPELYSLYSQFDLHPEKLVFGRTNVSGIKFFFWDSQFGRFFNTGPIKGHGDPTFFLHTTLWAFLPWSLVLYIAVYNLIKKRKTAQSYPERWLVYGSALITFLLFSFSKFQLPYYIAILFPHFSIITASYLTSIKSESTFKKLGVLQFCLLLIAAVAVCALSLFSHFGNIVIVAFISIGIAFYTLAFFRQPGLKKLIVTSSAISLVLFTFLLNFFYPPLLQYQAGMVAGKYLTDHRISAPAATLNAWSYSFEFYAPGFVRYVNSIDEIDKFIGNNATGAFYTNESSLIQLTQKGYQYTVLKEVPYFHISMLTGSFLNPATRATAVEKMLLILVRKK